MVALSDVEWLSDHCILHSKSGKNMCLPYNTNSLNWLETFIKNLPEQWSQMSHESSQVYAVFNACVKNTLTICKMGYLCAINDLGVLRFAYLNSASDVACITCPSGQYAVLDTHPLLQPEECLIALYNGTASSIHGYDLFRLDREYLKRPTPPPAISIDVLLARVPNLEPRTPHDIELMRQVILDAAQRTL